MLIKSFGLFWRASEIDWRPGTGAKGSFRLLGRRLKNQPGLKIADFRHQQGIYILYGNFGPYYVGLTRKQGLGKRLRDHQSDKHATLWDRFSWFGFCDHGEPDAESGICPIGPLPQITMGPPEQAIADIEALLIKSMGLSNLADMKFNLARKWFQIDSHETSYYVAKVRPSAA